MNPEPTPTEEKKGVWAHVVGFYRAMLKLGPAGILTAIASVSPPIGGFVILGLVAKIAPWIREHAATGALIYVVSFWFFGGFALVPTYAYSVLAGWTFGVMTGFWLAMAAFMGASIVAYLLAGWLAGDRATRMIDESPKWKAVMHALIGQGFWRTVWVVAIVRAPPTSPFTFISYVMALARVRMGAYLVGSFLGLAPRNIAYIIAAANIKDLDLNHPQEAWMKIAGIVLTLVAVYVVTRIAQNALKGVTGGAKA